ncbi:hypothetical protein JTB14_028024 [Gonioctena quinquepunctata]|nr:hypothetical protein JTB14_028024 [Gonioctena quinquepunctata]
MESNGIQTSSMKKNAVHLDANENDSNEWRRTKSKLSTYRKSSLSKKSKASSIATRLKIEAQVKADEALVRIPEQEKIMIQNRLAYEKAQMDEAYLEQSEVSTQESGNIPYVKLDEI